MRTRAVLCVLAALFSGVGIGIALGNEYVLAGLPFALSSAKVGQAPGRFLA
ncbi:YbfB/YjiJ family MFS transporter [Shigella flexneri]